MPLQHHSHGGLQGHGIVSLGVVPRLADLARGLGEVPGCPGLDKDHEPGVLSLGGLLGLLADHKGRDHVQDIPDLLKLRRCSLLPGLLSPAGSPRGLRIAAASQEVA